MKLKSNPFKSEKYDKKYYFKKRKINQNKDFLTFFKSLFKRGQSFKYTKNKNFEKNKSPYNEKPVYIDSYVKRRIPVWVIPSISIFLIIVMVFWIGPVAVKTLEGFLVKPAENSPGSYLLYNSDKYSVVSKQYADVYQSPDIRSRKLTQALFNEVVEILDNETYGFNKVRLSDGFEGYIREDSLTKNTGSVEPFIYSHKLVVTSQSKRVMSHSSSGSLLIETLMGTVLYADYQGSNIYRVALPDESFGWISASGLIRIDPDENIKESTAKKFYETALSYNNTTYFEGGMTKYGASMEGVLYISALINGIKLPRDLQLQANFGQQIELEYNDETDSLLYDNLKNGDLVFFGKLENETSIITGVGIVAGYGQVMTVRRSSSSIRIVMLDENLPLKNSIISVRRFFDN